MKIWKMAAVASLALLGGASCDPNLNAEEELSEQGLALSRSKASYVTLRRDMRKCVSPLCGGYFVRDVNKHAQEQYVSGLDLSRATLDEATQEKVLSAPESELVLAGRLGPREAQWKTRTFVVVEAYRGMPGVSVSAGDVFYQATRRDPQIQCFVAPCPNEIGRKLNTPRTIEFSSYSVERASRINVDQDWLTHRVYGHGAVVAGRMVKGQIFPGGPEKVLDASQVFVRLPDPIGPCPMFPIHQCPEGFFNTFQRNMDRCLIPTGCGDESLCPMVKPAPCAQDYTLSFFRANNPLCIEFVCDPTFLVE